MKLLRHSYSTNGVRPSAPLHLVCVELEKVGDDHNWESRLLGGGFVSMAELMAE